MGCLNENVGPFSSTDWYSPLYGAEKMSPDGIAPSNVTNSGMNDLRTADAAKAEQAKLDAMNNSPYGIAMGTLRAYTDMAPTLYGLESKYQPLYAGLQNQMLQNQVLGTPTFDAGKALQNDPWAIANRAQIEANAKAQNQTPEQWLQSHIQANPNDSAMQTLQKTYSTNQGGLLDLYRQATPQLGQMQAAANTQQRSADIADVKNLGGQALEAFKAANPYLTRSMSTLDTSVNAYANRAAPQASAGTLGSANLASVTNANGGPLLGLLETDASKNLGQVSPIQAMLQQQAMDQLGRNGQLSADEARNAQQAARAAAASRGIYDSNAALGQEVLNTDALTRQRQNEARTFAAAADAAGQSQINANRAYAQGVQGQGQNLSQFNAGSANTASLANSAAQNQFDLSRYQTEADMSKYNTALQMQQQQSGLSAQMQLANMYAAQAQDPFQMVLGRSGAVDGSMGAASQGQQNLASAGPGLFDPFNSTVMSFYNAQNNANSAANIASGNNKAANQSAAIGGGASIVGGVIAAL